jgi:arylesterase/paraoxonase
MEYRHGKYDRCYQRCSNHLVKPLYQLDKKGSFHPPHPNKHEENNGKIWIYNYANPGVEALTPLTGLPTDFHPLGLAFDAPTSTLYVINHSRYSGSVLEIFKVSLSTHSAKHIQTFTHPLLHAPNALHFLGNRKMYITNDHYMRAATSPLLSKIETFANIPGGSVVYVDLDAPAQAKVVARIGFANGVARLNASTLVVASSSKPGLYFFDIAADHGLVQKAFVRTPASADNLSVDGKGKVLVAGHPFAPQLMSVAKGRAGCEVERDAQCACGAPSWVGEWSEAEGLRTLLMSKGEEGICSSSTAVRDVERGVGMVSMLYGRGVVVFKE